MGNIGILLKFRHGVDIFCLMRYYDKVVNKERRGGNMKIEIKDENGKIIFEKILEKNSDYELNVLQETINMNKMKSDSNRLVPYH